MAKKSLIAKAARPQKYKTRNYSIGIREQIIFPEINYDDVSTIRGLDVTITTTAQTDEAAFALLRGLGLPFAADGSEGGA